MQIQTAISFRSKQGIILVKKINFLYYYYIIEIIFKPGLTLEAILYDTELKISKGAAHSLVFFCNG